MQRRLTFTDEKGVTLIELLAVITLLGIISIILYSVFFQGQKSEQRATNTIVLDQEANIFISELRSEYYKGKEKLCSNLSNNLHVDIDQTELINDGNILVFNEDGCIEGVNPKEPIEIFVTIANEDNKEVTIKSTWKNPQPKQLDIHLAGTGEPNNPDPPDVDDEDGPPVNDGSWETTGELPCLDNPAYQHKNVFWNGEGIEKDCQKYRGPNKSVHGTYKDLMVRKDFIMKENTNLNLNGNQVTFNKNVELKEGAYLTIAGNSLVKKDLVIKENASVIISGNVEAKQFTELKKNAQLMIAGHGTFKELVSKERSKITVAGNVNVLENTEIKEEATMIISGSGTFSSMELKERAQVTITGNMDVQKMIELKEKAKLQINGNGKFEERVLLKDGSVMSILGNATFLKPTEVNGQHNICVNGHVITDPVKHLTIKKCN